MFRCDPMAFCDIFIQPEAAFEVMSRLGDMNCVQFLDVNTAVPPYLKAYIGEVCRCDNVERKLRYIEAEMLKDKIPIPDTGRSFKPVQSKDMTAFENIVEKWENDIIDISENQNNLKQDLLEMKEMCYVLERIGPFLGDSDLESIFASNKGAGAGDFALGGRLYVMTGVVKRARSYPFQMMLWRVSRGNIYYKESEYDELLEDPYAGGQVRKVAFLAICQGEMLYTRMMKIISGFRVNLYPCPDTADERLDVLSKIKNRVLDLEEVYTKATYFRCRSLREVSKKWHECMVKMRKTKAIYHTMNLLTVDITKNYLIGKCWLPNKDLKKVQEMLRTCSKMVEAKVRSFLCKTETTSDPPTVQRTNKFTYAFQMLINAYGDAKYMEVNPGLFTIITFPFLFAVMFGDAGHATIIISFAVWMIIMEKEFMAQPGSEIWNIFFGGRYVILLLGLYSMFTGLIYNEIFSKSINFSSSMWRNTRNLSQLQQNIIQLGGSSRMNTPYVYGMDPIWRDAHDDIISSLACEIADHGIGLMILLLDVISPTTALIAIGKLFSPIKTRWYFARERRNIYHVANPRPFSTNKILIENSMKMKMSLIIGVIHMLFGIILSIFNHVYFKNYYSIVLEFLPEFIFLTCIFFWLVIMIFLKWLYYYDGHSNVQFGSSCAPPILIIFIDMVLLGSPAKAEPDEGCKLFFFPSQPAVQMILVLLALSVVPVLLLGTPLYITYRNKKKREKIQNMISRFRIYQIRSSADEKAHAQLKLDLAKYTSSFGDLIIHQGVHTIEFVLSTVSHTASYLRLWALSLAHSQLSEMLWMMVLSKLSLQTRDGSAVYKIFIIFPIWAFFTVAILVVMEGLSSFLHTLRLHWVEFMSKFYIGGGHTFLPFSFNKILALDSNKPEGACSTKVKRLGMQAKTGAEV